MSTRSTRPKISYAGGLTLLTGIGAVMGYLLPTQLLPRASDFLKLIGSNSASSQLAAVLLMYLLGAVLYYGMFIVSVKLLQAYGFLAGVKDLHNQSHFLVFGYILLVVVDIALWLTPNSLWNSSGYPILMAALYGLLFAAVAGLTNIKATAKHK